LGSDGASDRLPIDVDFSCSKTGFHVVAASVDFQIPPPVEPK
jgi:hypothetical protein